MKKSPLELALQRSQIALHEAALEVGRLKDFEDRVKRALTRWHYDDTNDHVIIEINTDLLSILPPMK